MELDVLAIYESFGELHSDRSLTASDRPKSLVKKGGNAETWNADLACDKPLENYASGAGLFQNNCLSVWKILKIF